MSRRLAPFVVADGLFGDAVGTRLAVLATGWVVLLCRLAGGSRAARRIGLELTPVIIMNSSPAMCGALPVPTDAMLSLSGCAGVGWSWGGGRGGCRGVVSIASPSSRAGFS
jgi:hypothetical protein